jgi:hypothetical protein
MNNLKWVCNDVRNPTLAGIVPNPGESAEEAFQKHMRWRRNFKIGDPAPTKELTVEELKRAGIIGLYTDDLVKFI